MRHQTLDELHTIAEVHTDPVQPAYDPETSALNAGRSFLSGNPIGHYQHLQARNIVLRRARYDERRHCRPSRSPSARSGARF